MARFTHSRHQCHSTMTRSSLAHLNGFCSTSILTHINHFFFFKFSTFRHRRKNSWKKKKNIYEQSIIDARSYFLGTDMTASCNVNRISKKILWWNWLIKDIKLTAYWLCMRRWMVKNRERVSLNTYTSTKTGKAASRNSSRQLGGYRIWTWTRVPWFNVISNECFFGSASLSRRCLIDEFAMLNSSCNNIFVLIECTPAKRRCKTERDWSN